MAGFLFYWYNVLMMNGYMNYINKILFGSILVTLAALPLFFCQNIWHSFELAKVMLFNGLTVWLISVFSLKTLFSGELAYPKDRVLIWTFLVYLSIRILSALNSDYPAVALMGSGLRGFGLLTELELWFFAYLIYSEWPYIKKRLSLALFIVSLTATLTSIYGLAQIAGFDFFQWQIFEPFLLRATSTIGQPNHLAAYLLLAMPFGLWGLLVDRGLWRVYFFFTLGVQLAALIFTLSRGAWVGFIIAVMIALGFYIKRMWPMKANKIFGSSLVALAVILFLAFYGARYNTDDSKSLSNRVTGIFSLNQGAYRIKLYQTGLDLFFKKPLLGYGQDTQVFEIFPYYQGSWAITEAININSDRFHNIFLDLLFESGLLALCGILGLAFIFMYRVIDFYKNNHYFYKDPNISLLLLGLAAFFVSLQFSFVAIVPAVYAALAIGIVSSKVTEASTIQLNGRRYLSVLILPFLLWLALANANNFKASFALRQAISAMNILELNQSVNNILTLSSRSQYQSFYQAELFRLATWHIGNDKIDRGNTKALLDSLLSKDIEPVTFQSRLYRLMLLTDLLPIGGSGKQNPLFLELEDKFNDFQGLAPGYAIIEMAWGDLYYRVADHAIALKHYEAAIDLYPAITEKLMNTEHRELVVGEEKLVIKKIVDTSIRLRKFDLAMSYIDLGQSIAPIDVDWFKLRLRIYLEQKNDTKAKQIIKEGVRLFPRDDYFKTF